VFLFLSDSQKIEEKVNNMQKLCYDIALSYASEDKEVVDSVYHYLRGSGLTAFYAPECQDILVGENQEEIFFQIFSREAHHAVLFVSCHYVAKPVPMKEAKICMANRQGSQLLPVYLDGTPLPGLDLSINFFRSDDPEKIATMIIKRLAPFKKSRQEVPEKVIAQTDTSVGIIQHNNEVNVQGDHNQVVQGAYNQVARK